MNVHQNAVVLFDIDGTLLRGAGPHHKLALIEGIRQVTYLSTTFDGIDTAGQLDCDLLVALLRKAGDPSPHVHLPALIEACQTAYLEHCPADLSCFVCPGVRDFLQRLAGAQLGLVTGNLSAIAWKKMELARLRSYFSFGAFAEDGHTRAELARVAVQRANPHPAARVTLIGDHANDIAAAKANGYSSVAVATGVLSFEELSAQAPDYLVHSLDKLPVECVL